MYTIRIWGDRAFFASPEFKSEGLTYRVPTRTALKGFLESIFWHENCHYIVQSLEILKPIQTQLIMKNYLSSIQTPQRPFLDIEQDRTQRHLVILRDVEYLVTFDIDFPVDRPRYKKMLERRMSKGQSYHSLYLGIREFFAYYELVEDKSIYQPENINEYLGQMLWDVKWGKKCSPIFKPHTIKQGVVTYA
jgi:CRISPR-associated protein Cas5d